MVLTIQEFNRQVKVIDVKLVSLLETWNKYANEKRYQLKSGDIFRMTIEREKKYFMYYSISEAFEITDDIEIYLEYEEIENINAVDFSAILDYFCFDSYSLYFEPVIENGEEVYQGIETLNDMDVELIYINDKSTKDQFIEEWKDKEIVQYNAIKGGYASFGKLGETTPVPNVFVGDMFDVIENGVTFEDNIVNGKFNTCTVIKYKGDYLLVSFFSKYDLEEAFNNKEVFKIKKLKSYKNLTVHDICWISDDATLV